MGRNSGEKKARSSFSIFSFFKSRRGRKGDVYDHCGSWDEASSTGKVWPSDEDKAHHWVAEPGIDRKAKDYIDRIYRNRVIETERETVIVRPS